MVNLERVGVNLTVDQKHVLLTVLGIGVSFGVGLGVNKWRNHDMAVQIKDVLHELIVDGKHVKDTFKEFPHYLSERTRWLLTSAACLHLKPVDVSKHTRNLSPASRSILLSGPGEFYHQRLAKALSHEFKTKLLVLDIDNFSAKLQNKNGTSKKDSFAKRSFNKGLEQMSRVLLPFSTTTGYGGASLNYPFDEKVFFQELHKVLVSFSETNGIILYIKDIERCLQSPRTYRLFEKMLKRLTGSTLVIGSRMSESGNTKDVARLEPLTEDELLEKWLKSVMGIPLIPESQESVKVNAKISRLFPYNIEINPPADKSHLKDWDTQVEEQKKNNLSQDNKKHIAEVLKANDLECDDLGSVCQADTILISNDIQEIVVYAISHHLMSHKDLVYRNGKLVISSTSLLHGLSIFKEDKLKTKADSSKEVPDNEFEKRIRPEVIPPNEIGVTFEDIGALDETKESLQELVMLPLKRPDLFNGGLLKPCRGILLFGPPGTGKTMLAKAIANEAGASFINVSMSTITSKWIGESEKTVRALFTLAAKVSPTIMFVDEVDSMLGQRSQEGEYEVMRALKNEFMSHWDGLLTKPGERILVLAATNRPFDLDEAIIRRFERRIMVGLPSLENREKILKTLLVKENVEDLDFKELAAMTEGYSGSDLKQNLCVTASYRPVRELMQQEKQKAMVKKGSEAHSDKKEKSSSVIKPRHLNMEDMRQAANKVAASFAGGGSVMGELKQWNELYGEGGSRKKEQLSYFL